MSVFNVYVVSSYRNKHAVELLTNLLEHIGCKVVSFIRTATEFEKRLRVIDIDEWFDMEDALKKFQDDVFWATKADLVIYLGPSGCDSWAEVGAAYASKRTIYGLRVGNEQIGLMRKMITRWFDDVSEMITFIKDNHKTGGK